MGLLIPEDREYDESVRQTGFNRYKQLLSNRFGQWCKLNLLTLAGAVPLAGGILYAIGTSSILVLFPCAAVGGAIFGPFLSGLYDGIFRGLRDDPRPWWENYKKSWRQNALGSLLPGMILGLLIGIYAFMGMLFWWADAFPTGGTIVLYLCALLLTLVLLSLYWPQMVLFSQSPTIRLRNCLLFCIKYFWRVMGTGILQLAYWALYVLFAPWTLLLLPILGFWYILFLSQFLLYDQMNDAFHIE